jgi:hypothetical protein
MRYRITTTRMIETTKEKTMIAVQRLFDWPISVPQYTQTQKKTSFYLKLRCIYLLILRN